MLLFQRASIAAVCAALGKRHPSQGVPFQLTRRNCLQLLAEGDRFALVFMAEGTK